MFRIQSHLSPDSGIFVNPNLDPEFAEFRSLFDLLDPNLKPGLRIQDLDPKEIIPDPQHWFAKNGAAHSPDKLG